MFSGRRQAGPLPGTHSRNRQPELLPPPILLSPLLLAPLSNNYSTHRYSPFNQHFNCLYVSAARYGIRRHGCAYRNYSSELESFVGIGRQGRRQKSRRQRPSIIDNQTTVGHCLVSRLKERRSISRDFLCSLPLCFRPS